MLAKKLPHNKLVPKIVAQVLELRLQALPANQIAEQVGIARGTVFDIYRRNGVKSLPNLVKKLNESYVITEEIKPKLLRLRDQELSIDAIAEQTGIHRATLHGFFVANGVGSISPRRPPELKETVRMLRSDGMSLKEIAEEVGLSYSAIKVILRKPKDEPKGEKQARPSKITFEIGQRVLKLREQGMGTRTIAEKIGVSRPTVQRFFDGMGIIGNPPPKSKEAISHKTCLGVCGLNKPVEEFYVIRYATKNGEEHTTYDYVCTECHNAAAKEYRQSEEGKQTRREYEQYRKDTDPTYKMHHLMSVLIGKALKKQGVEKEGPISSYLPYSDLELVEHFAYQMVGPNSWMTLQNNGIFNPDTWVDDDPSTWTWQIDHIIPKSEFHYTSMEDENFQKCWALSNLRPLSAKQNQHDGATRARHTKTAKGNA